MTKHYLHAVIFNPDEIEDDCKEYLDDPDCLADYITSGDYVVHALYDLADKRCIVCNDNCHAHIEDEIEWYLAGVADCGVEAKVVFDIFVTNGDSYSSDVDDLIPLRNYCKQED